MSKNTIIIIIIIALISTSVFIYTKHFTGGPLILVFDVEGKLLLRERGVFKNEDYPIIYRNGNWYITRPDKIAKKYLKSPLPKTSVISIPYKTRTINGWYYVLESRGVIRAVKSDGLISSEVKYFDDRWQIKIEDEWQPFFE